VAGTGQVRSEDAAYDNKVILWSDFSDVMEPLAIPRRVYFFPVSVQETAKAADIQVCRYVLGYWYSEQFMVKRGEVIGKTAKVTLPAQKQKDKDELVTPEEQEVKLPETIDYTTGVVLVDLVAVNDWAGEKNLQQRQYFDMLYSFDGSGIERIAAKLTYWPDEVRAKYSEIKALEKRPKAVFREWNSSWALGGTRATPGTQMRGQPDRGSIDPRMDEMTRMRTRQP
jgi:hypothetical protein